MDLFLGKPPSNLDSFLVIKEQINNINRPDRTVDWKLVQNLSEQISIENGIDLQTLSYSIVADLKLTKDSCRLIDSIEKMSIALTAYWKDIWPQDISARILILNWLNRHISDGIKDIDTNIVNIKDLYRLENSIKIILEIIKFHTEIYCNLSNLLDVIQGKITLFFERNKSNDNLSINKSEIIINKYHRTEKENILDLEENEFEKDKIRITDSNILGDLSSSDEIV